MSESKKERDERIGFFTNVKRMEAERLERWHNDVEERKRFILRCASNGGMRHVSTKKVKVTLPKLSILEKKP